MLSTSTRLRLRGILDRVAKGQEVSLTERVYVHKFADHDQTVSSWLKRARRLQQQKEEFSADSIENLINDLDLGPTDPNSAYCPDEDDLGEWFGGAPSWLGRS